MAEGLVFFSILNIRWLDLPSNDTLSLITSEMLIKQSLLLSSSLNLQKYYNDPINQRTLIRTENSGKLGIYAWENKINGKLYIGSGDPLYLRISDYYQKWYMDSRSNLYIVRALSKHGMTNFSLHILEYTNEENLIACEQKWIDKLKPEYNINPIAGNSKGYKHSPESIEKMQLLAKGRKHTEETKKGMSINRKGLNNSFYGKTHTLKSKTLMKEIALNRTDPSNPGISVEITDLTSKSTRPIVQ